MEDQLFKQARELAKMQGLYKPNSKIFISFVTELGRLAENKLKENKPENIADNIDAYCDMFVSLLAMADIEGIELEKAVRCRMLKITNKL